MSRVLVGAGRGSRMAAAINHERCRHAESLAMIFVTAAFGDTAEATLPGFVKAFGTSNPDQTLYVVTDRGGALRAQPHVEVVEWSWEALVSLLPAYYRTRRGSTGFVPSLLVRMKTRFPDERIVWISPDAFVCSPLLPLLPRDKATVVFESARWGFYPTQEAGGGVVVKAGAVPRSTLVSLGPKEILWLRGLAEERPRWPGPFTGRMVQDPLVCLLAHFVEEREVHALRNGKDAVWSVPLRAQGVAGVPGDRRLRKYDVVNQRLVFGRVPVALFDWCGYLQHHVAERLQSFKPHVARYLRSLLE